MKALVLLLFMISVNHAVIIVTGPQAGDEWNNFSVYDVRWIVDPSEGSSVTICLNMTWNSTPDCSAPYSTEQIVRGTPNDGHYRWSISVRNVDESKDCSEQRFLIKIVSEEKGTVGKSDPICVTKKASSIRGSTSGQTEYRMVRKKLSFANKGAERIVEVLTESGERVKHLSANGIEVDLGFLSPATLYIVLVRERDSLHRFLYLAP